MKKEDYIKQLENVEIDKDKVRKVGDIYGNDLPETVQRIISNSEESVFFDDNSRMLAFEEILDAEQDLHVDFREKGMLPLADCGENDFIVYHVKDRLWSVFNIVDEAIFRKKNSLEELMS